MDQDRPQDSAPQEMPSQTSKVASRSVAPLKEKYLHLLKLDAQALMQRLEERKKAALEIFALRRTRDHFPGLFETRYSQLSMQELSYFSIDTMTTLHQFYQIVEEMRWYLYRTEDMPGTVEETLSRMHKRLEKIFSTLSLYLDAESTGELG
jgi:hypothetical protein